MGVELHGAEVWVTDTADLVVTVPIAERDHQSEIELRGRLARAVHHRFATNKEVLITHLKTAHDAALHTIEDNPVLHTSPQYGVVLVKSGVHA